MTTNDTTPEDEDRDLVQRLGSAINACRATTRRTMMPWPTTAEAMAAYAADDAALEKVWELLGDLASEWRGWTPNTSGD